MLSLSKHEAAQTYDFICRGVSLRAAARTGRRVKNCCRGYYSFTAPATARSSSSRAASASRVTVSPAAS